MKRTPTQTEPEKKVCLEHLKTLAARARRLANDADPGVAELFLFHAAVCERLALNPISKLKPISKKDHLRFDDKGRPKRGSGPQASNDH